MIIFAAFIALYKIIDFVYLFQIKEYRFDRMRSTLFEHGPIRFFLNFKIKFPALTLRNLLLTGVATLELLISIYLIAVSNSVSILIWYIVLSPFIAWLYVSFGVLVTKPIAFIQRQRIITSAKQKARQSKAICIGISGTYGKTSTKEYLFQMLSTKYQTAKTDRNMNTDIGVALSILRNLKPETQFFIAEVGAYRKGEVKNASLIFPPKYAIITSFGNQHLDLYGSRENLIAAESEILHELPSNGIAYINEEIPQLKQITEGLQCTVKTFAHAQNHADICIQSLKETEDEMNATILYHNELLNIQTTLIGKHNVVNLLPCIMICREQGMSVDEITKAIKGLKQVEGKLSLHKGYAGSKILNDASNSSVEGFLAAINAAQRFQVQKKFIISKGIIELGKEKGESYQKIVNALAQTPLQLYTTDQLFKKFDTSGKIAVFPDEASIFKKISEFCDANTLLILEGKFTKAFIDKLILL